LERKKTAKEPRGRVREKQGEEIKGEADQSKRCHGLLGKTRKSFTKPCKGKKEVRGRPEMEVKMKIYLNFL